MKKLFVMCAAASTLFCSAQVDRIIEFDVWEGQKPPHASTLTAEQGVNAQGHITNCQTARVELYLPKGGADKTVIICPGGGYGILAVEHEGRDFARFLCDNGIAAAVLSYRMPNGVHQIPLEDLKQSYTKIRKFARSWKLNPNKVGFMGFSAGGHLAAVGSVYLKPAFSVLFYPVISSNEAVIHKGSFASLCAGDRSLYDYYSAEKHVTKRTPPALLFHSIDDQAVLIANSELYRDALTAKGIPAKLVTFAEGGHGWGFNKNFASHGTMKAQLLEWLLAL